MPTYKVLAEFEVEGGLAQVNSQVELSEEAAAPLLEEGKVELVGDQSSGDSAGEGADDADDGADDAEDAGGDEQSA